MKSDSELLTLYVKRKSGAAFRELLSRHLDWVYTLALRQVGNDRHLAEDVCQEVFAAFGRKAETLVGYGVINGWLFRATRFAASDVVRSEQRRRKREEEAGQMDAIERRASEELKWEDAGELLDEVIGELGDGDREAVCLRFFEGLRYADLGERLGLQENTARMRVNRALERMQVLLKQRGITSTVAAVSAVMGSHQLVSAPSILAASLGSGALGTVGLSVGYVSAHKLVVASLALLASSGIGVATVKYQENGDLRERLAEAEARIESRETVAVEAQSRESGVSGFVPSRQSIVSTDVAATALSNERPQTADVEARWKEAQRLHDEGYLEEALSEYLWLLDTGMRDNVRFAGLRSSILLARIKSIGEVMPNAIAELKLRRDRIEEAIMTGQESDLLGHLDVNLWARLNASFDEPSRSLAVLDRTEDEELRENLRRSLRKELIGAQRYQEALLPGESSRALMQFDFTKNREPSDDVPPEEVDAHKVRIRRYAIKTLVESIEVLAGAGEPLEAIELAERLLEFDSDVDTVDLLTESLRRAGDTVVLNELLSKEG